jgi:hypothetical protein
MAYDDGIREKAVAVLKRSQRVWDFGIVGFAALAGAAILLWLRYGAAIFIDVVQSLWTCF